MSVLNYLSGITVQSPWMLGVIIICFIPIVIHLFNKRRATRVLFANIKLITAQKPQHMREIRVTEASLLLLRLILFFLSVLIIAQLVVYQPKINSTQVSLVTADWLKHTDEEERREILDRDDAQIWFLLSSDVKALSREQIRFPQTILASSDLALSNSSINENINLYELLNLFASRLTNKTNLTIYTTDQANQYHGVHVKPQWQATSTINWQIKAIEPSDTRQTLSHAVSVVIIFDENRKEDLTLFQQALVQIKQHNAPMLDVNYIAIADVERDYALKVKTPPNWIFYLSSAPLSTIIERDIFRGSHFFSDAAFADPNMILDQPVIVDKESSEHLYQNMSVFQYGEPIAIEQFVTQGNIASINNTLIQGRNQKGQRFPLLEYSRFQSSSAKQAPTDVTNRQAKTTPINAHIYRFYTRFTSTWTDIAKQNQFPLLLQKLMFNSWQVKYFSSTARLTSEQIKAGYNTIKQRDNATKPVVIPFMPINIEGDEINVINQFLFICFLLLWGIERLLSEWLTAKWLTKTKGETA